MALENEALIQYCESGLPSEQDECGSPWNQTAD